MNEELLFDRKERTVAILSLSFHAQSITLRALCRGPPVELVIASKCPLDNPSRDIHDLASAQRCLSCGGQEYFKCGRSRATSTLNPFIRKAQQVHRAVDPPSLCNVVLLFETKDKYEQILYVIGQCFDGSQPECILHPCATARS